MILYSWVCGECDQYHSQVKAVRIGERGDRIQVRCQDCRHVETIADQPASQAAMRRRAQ